MPPFAFPIAGVRVRAVVVAATMLSCAPAFAETLAVDTEPAGPAARNTTAATPAPAPYVGYTGTLWNVDYGVMRGRCDRAAVATALGDPKAAVPGQPPVALLSGVDADGADRACAAHAIELLRNGRTVRWKGTGGTMSVTPMRDTVSGAQPCRDVVLRGLGKPQRATACSTEAGVWQLVSR
ncbi:MAG: hypothetical protein MUF30_01790 [Burkholderiales bacterium]|jgi:hypothetical protein|nr:hypothetical protein [Burkholderiales bacterium]